MSTRPMIHESYNNIESEANLLQNNNNNKSTTNSSENKTSKLKKENQKYGIRSPLRKYSSTLLSDFKM